MTHTPNHRIADRAIDSASVLARCTCGATPTFRTGDVQIARRPISREMAVQWHHAHQSQQRDHDDRTDMPWPLPTEDKPYTLTIGPRGAVTIIWWWQR